MSPGTVCPPLWCTGRLYPPSSSDSLWSQGSASVREARALRFDRCALACLGFRVCSGPRRGGSGATAPIPIACRACAPSFFVSMPLGLLAGVACCWLRGLLATPLWFLPSGAISATPTLSSLRPLGFSFLNSLFLFFSSLLVRVYFFLVIL